MPTTAVALWQGRIAPVFDTAREFRLLQLEEDEIVADTPLTLSGRTPAQRTAELRENGVECVVCGAISRPLQEELERAGVVVRAFVAGGLTEIVAALREDRLADRQYRMPGCRRQGMSGGGRGCCKRQGGAGQTGCRNRKGTGN